MAPLQSLMSELEKDKHHRFPNLAVTKCLYDHEGEPLRNEKVFKETDDAVCAELAAAGLEKESIFQNDALRYSGKGRYFEVPASVVGLPHRWQLRRAWGTGSLPDPEFPPSMPSRLTRSGEKKSGWRGTVPVAEPSSGARGSPSGCTTSTPRRASAPS